MKIRNLAKILCFGAHKIINKVCAKSFGKDMSLKLEHYGYPHPGIRQTGTFPSCLNPSEREQKNIVTTFRSCMLREIQ